VGSPEDRRRLEKTLRRAQRTLLIYVSLAMAGVAVLWGAHEYAGLPAWPAYTFGCVAGYAIVTEVSNIVYFSRKLRLL
jgi:hypothetical protein